MFRSTCFGQNALFLRSKNLSKYLTFRESELFMTVQIESKKEVYKYEKKIKDYRKKRKNKIRQTKKRKKVESKKIERRKKERKK